MKHNLHTLLSSISDGNTTSKVGPTKFHQTGLTVKVSPSIFVLVGSY